jgi:hypothetical protein
VPRENVAPEPLTIAWLLRVVRGEFHSVFVRLLLQTDQMEIKLNPHPLVGLIPELQKLPETAKVSVKVLPLSAAAHPLEFGEPFPHVFVVRFW